MSKQLEIGDIVFSSEIAYHDVARGILTEYHPWMEDIYFKPDVELLRLSRRVVNSIRMVEGLIQKLGIWQNDKR